LNPGHHIDYKQLRSINPRAARTAVLNYYARVAGNVSQTARAFSINRCVVYDILKKQAGGDLNDRSRAPKYQPRKTPASIEEQVIAAKNKTHKGPTRLSLYLAKYEGLQVAPGTIRHILRRNREALTYPSLTRMLHKEKREFIDWYSAKPFEIVQIDLKHIRDHKALSKAQMIHLDHYDTPNYQWSAMDVNSRFKMIAYSRGKSWMKVKELRKLIAAFDCRLIQNHKGHCEENAHLERSHRTDDEEFYIPRTFKLCSDDPLLDESMGYIYYYNNVREHSALNYQPLFQVFEQRLPDIDDSIRYTIPLLLDNAAVEIGPWCGYNVLAHYLNMNIKICNYFPNCLF